MTDKPTVVIDASQLFSKIAALKEGTKAAPFLMAIGLRLMGWVDQHFRNPVNPTWAPLRPSTIAGRRKGGGGAKPLQDTGRLRMSWTRAAGNPHIFGDHTVQVTSNVAYAPFHQFGTKPYVIRPKKPGGRLRFMTADGPRFAGMVRHPGVPARPMTPPAAVAEKLAVDTLEAALAKLVKMNKAAGG